MARSLKLLVLLASIIGANGTPSPTEAAAAVKSSYCANFDDLPQNPTGFDSTKNPVNTYKGIDYKGFYVATEKNFAGGTNFFVVPSKPNVAIGGVYGFTGSFLLQLNTTATGSPSDSFDLTSMRFGCILTDGPNEVGGLNNCGALFVGNKRSGDDSVVFEYEYNSTPKLDTIKFPKGFTGLSEVFLTISAVGQVGPSPILDNVCVSIHG